MSNTTATQLYSQQLKALPLDEQLRLMALLAHDIAEKLPRCDEGQSALSDEEMKRARDEFERHIGAASLGYPTGADNESIDRDLAREYGSTHKEG